MLDKAGARLKHDLVRLGRRGLGEHVDHGQFGKVATVALIGGDAELQIH